MVKEITDWVEVLNNTFYCKKDFLQTNNGFIDEISLI